MKPFIENQIWDDLKNKYSEKHLFIDEEFKADNSSIYFSEPENEEQLQFNSIIPDGIVWKRPKEINTGIKPEFVVNGFNRFDLGQGKLGDCWFIAGCAALTQCESVLKKVVPTDQGFDENYGGIFHFRFWLYDEWVDVLIDDQLPCIYNEEKKTYSLIFCKNNHEPNEYWAPLLEKAYAKFYGFYGRLDGGRFSNTMIDLSGGITERFKLVEMSEFPNDYLWNVLYAAYDKNSMMGCTINDKRKNSVFLMDQGLVKKHQFTIIKLCKFYFKKKLIRLIYIRNPWGGKHVWKGSWSDGSPEWNSLDQKLKEQIGFVKKADGEFWMSYDDFKKNWDIVEICHLNVETFSSELINTKKNSNIKYELFEFKGQLGKDTNDEQNNKNQKFNIRVDKLDKNTKKTKKQTIFISLMQSHVPSKLKNDLEHINFDLYKVEKKVDNLNEISYLKYLVDRSGFTNLRSFTKRFLVEPGSYQIIPTINEYKNDVNFLLKVYKQKKIETKTEIKTEEQITPGKTSVINKIKKNIIYDKLKNAFKRKTKAINYNDKEYEPSSEDEEDNEQENQNEVGNKRENQNEVENERENENEVDNERENQNEVGNKRENRNEVDKERENQNEVENERENQNEVENERENQNEVDNEPENVNIYGNIYEDYEQEIETEELYVPEIENFEYYLPELGILDYNVPEIGTVEDYVPESDDDYTESDYDDTESEDEEVNEPFNNENEENYNENGRNHERNNDYRDDEDEDSE